MRAVKRWQDLEVLIIDEISMIDRPLFELLDKVGREIRRNHDRPFGGIQVVVVGDFLQLPPVPSKYTKTREFCFESPVWNDLGLGFTDEYGYIHSDNINTMVWLSLTASLSVVQINVCARKFNLCFKSL